MAYIATLILETLPMFIVSYLVAVNFSDNNDNDNDSDNDNMDIIDDN